MLGEILNNQATYIISVAVIFVIFLVLYIRQNRRITIMTRKYDKFMKGKNAENLDEAIRESFKQVEEINIAHQKSMIKMDEAINRVNSVFQKLGIVKYNAFKEMGGNLSFALCLLNSENTGFIINTMHGREGSYTYVKEIIKGEAYSTLGEEEKEALDKAMNS